MSAIAKLRVDLRSKSPVPIFDFKCVRCGHCFEELVRGDQIPACPQCAASNAERQFPLSVAVSTPKSRARTSAIARRAVKATHKDMQVADAESLRHHIKEERGGE
jgi:putative FmdB family regulatory protein